MLGLMGAFSIEKIITFIILLALAIKGVWGYVDWAKGKYQDKFNKDYIQKEKEQKQKEIDDTFEQQIKEAKNYYNELNNTINTLTNTVNRNFDIMNKAMTHDIKQWIFEKHKFYMEQGWIDVNELDVIESRYVDYIALGGNSIVPTLMQELRSLPKHVKARR